MEVYCRHFDCQMTVNTCESNQHKAVMGMSKLQEKGLTIYQLADCEIDRVLVCGKCVVCSVNENDVSSMFRQSLNQLAEEVCKYDGWDMGSDELYSVMGR